MTRAQVVDPAWAAGTTAKFFMLGVTQVMLAVFCVVVAMRVNRLHRRQLIERKLWVAKELESRVRELEARLSGADASVRSQEAAVAAVAAGLEPVIAATQVRPQPSSSLRGEELIRLISHEVRTPLATIHGYSELLFDGEPPEESIRHDIFGIMQGETQRMSQVLESLLNLSRLDLGTLSPRREPVAFNPLVGPAVDHAASLAELRKVTLERDLAGDLPEVVGDAELLGQAARNLLSHVLKHTEAGGRINVRSGKSLANGSVVLEITGTRVGVSPKDLPSALDNFYGCGDSDDSAIPPGTAGLALSRRVVALHGGKVFMRVGPDACTLGFELPPAPQSAGRCAKSGIAEVSDV